MENLSGFVNTRFARRYCVVILYPVLILALVFGICTTALFELICEIGFEARRRLYIANSWAGRIWRM